MTFACKIRPYAEGGINNAERAKKICAACGANCNLRERLDKMGICFIIGAMTCQPLPPLVKGDFLIAADGGYSQLGDLKPDAVVGDFDSLGYIPESEYVVRHPVRKDDTDMMLAVRLGLERGYTRFCLYGAMGGRLDHTLANIQTLSYLAERGAIGCLVGSTESACVIKNGALDLSGRAGKVVSVFAHGGEARGVRLEGLEYPLENAVLTCDFPLGVSNAFKDGPARISVASGSLLVIWQGGIESTGWLEDRR